MKSKPTEYDTFSEALKKVVGVSRSDLKKMLDDDKAAKAKRKPKKVSVRVAEELVAVP